MSLPTMLNVSERSGRNGSNFPSAALNPPDNNDNNSSCRTELSLRLRSDLVVQSSRKGQGRIWSYRVLVKALLKSGRTELSLRLGIRTTD